MGQLVATLASCHAPQLLTLPPDENPEALAATTAAMARLGELLEQAKPDLLIVLGSDHLETFGPSCVPTFALVTGTEAASEFANRRLTLPIHRRAAATLLERLVRAGFDVASAEGVLLGHAFAVPFDLILRGRQVPVIPIHTNVYLPPLPSPARCAAFGRELAKGIADGPDRVAILASGGMSHYPGTAKYAAPDFEFDRWLLTQLERGDTRALLELSGEELDHFGNTELLTWSILLGAAGAVRAEILCYTPTWHHGHAVVRFVPATSSAEQGARYPRSRSAIPAAPVYRRPLPEHLGFNRLLFGVRADARIRAAIEKDLDWLVSEYGLSLEQRKLVEALPSAASAVRVSDHVAPLVEAGAHPLQALMALHSLKWHRG